MAENKLTAADVLASEIFESNIEKYLRTLTDNRNQSVEQLTRAGRKPKPTLFDWLADEGLTNPALFTSEFLNVLNKEAKGYTMRQRQFIHAIGMECYRATLIEMRKNEKKPTENTPN